MHMVLPDAIDATHLVLDVTDARDAPTTPGRRAGRREAGIFS